MKKIFTLLVLMLIVASCGNKKEKNRPSYGKQPKITKQEEKKVSPLIAEGEKLFTSKTCTGCHLPDKKVIGPSIKTITKTYKEKNASIVAFLQSKSKPIVDTDPGQVAIMKANLDGFVKQMSEDELKAINAYMNSL